MGRPGTLGQGEGPTHPVRAEQAWVRQSRRPILEVQSLNAVLISGMERQVWGGGGGEGQAVRHSPSRLRPLPGVRETVWPPGQSLELPELKDGG